MSKKRLDRALVERGLVSSRSQAEHYIKLGYVEVNGQPVLKPSFEVAGSAKIRINSAQYVSRAALKLASVAETLGLDFRGKLVIDVGSSTGGFTDYALKHGAKRVIAVDIGSGQLHPDLRADSRVEPYEKTDIRSFKTKLKPEIILIDVSFISLRLILPAVAALSKKSTQIVAMVKPQFEAGVEEAHKGVIKNDTVRRRILKNFENWAKKHFVLSAKADSKVAGSHGNLERFYLLKPML
ncbi:MAG: TlyA family RNA methyltransferase [Candidatus Saccharimonadales bacterium]